MSEEIKPSLSVPFMEPIGEVIINEDKRFDISVMGLSPWSHSKYKRLDKCPLQFYLQDILRLRDVARPITLETEVGKAAHEILERTVNGKPLAKVMDQVKKEYLEKGRLTADQWENNVENLEMSFQNFQEKMDQFDINFKVKRIMQELRLAVNRDWEPTGFFAEDCFFRGVIDLGIEVEAGDMIFIDYKTGAPAIMGTKNFQDQLDKYKILFHYGMKNIPGAGTGIFFIRDNEIKMGTFSDASEIEQSLQPRLMFALQGVIDKLEELGYFKHIAGSQCKWCDFREGCKSGGYKELEKESKKWFKIKEIK